MQRITWFFVLLAGIASANTTPSLERVRDDFEVTHGQMLCTNPDGSFRLPLLKTEVDARISGLLARVNVRQVFINTSNTVLEAEYLFPLGEGSAVDSMEFRTPGRIIRGVVKLAEQAEKEYQQAKAQGKRATVLHQMRNNLFRQKIANLMPGDTIEVRISYLEELEYDFSVLRFHFPLTVGPYFNPANTDIKHAAKVSTTYITPKNIDVAKVSLQVRVLKAPGVALLHSPSHRVRIGESVDKQWWELALGEGESIPNKDFLLEVPFRNEEMSSQLLIEERDGERFFQYILYPPALKTPATFARELVFVVDVSGSMSGHPLQKSKEVMRTILEKMQPSERFRVVLFSNNAQDLFAEPVAATAQNIESALDFLDRRMGGGGTNFMAAIDQIFPVKREVSTTDLQKVVLFLTDGYIGNEDEIILNIRDRAMGNRVFTLGVGNSVNHSLLQGMAHAGGGIHTTIRTDGDAQKAMNDFYARIDAPLLTGLRIEGNDLMDAETFPKRISNLTAGRPVQITGQLKSKGPVRLHASARLPSGQLWRNTVEASATVQQVGLASLWARKKVAHIKLFQGSLFHSGVRMPDSSKKQIEDLGTRYQIMTDYTSFIAVEEMIVNNGGRQTKILQPSVAPEAVNMQTAGGAMPAYSLMASRGAGLSARKGITISKGRHGKADGGFNHGYASAPAHGETIDDLLSSNPVPSTGPRPQVQSPVGELQIHQGMQVRSIDELSRVIRARSPGLRHRYSKQLKENPGLSGKMIVRITIAATGEVNQIELQSSTMGNANFEKEILEALKQWRWKVVAKGAVVFQFPLVFSH